MTQAATTTATTGAGASGGGSGVGGVGGMGGSAAPPPFLAWPDSLTVLCSDGKAIVKFCPGKPTDPAWGQDGNYLINTPSYDAGANTVKDTRSGLEWQRAVAAPPVDWGSAKAYCAGLSLDGGGWRVPSRDELVSMMDYGKLPWPAVFGKPDINQPYFWASDTSAGDPKLAWTIDSIGAYAAPLDKTAANTVRCVRGGGKLAGPRYAADGDVVHDALTGLTWQAQDPNGGTWLEMLAYCENLDLQGFKDWRLPSVKELITIADTADKVPAIDPAFAYIYDGGLFYTSTPTPDGTNAYVVDFFQGATTNANTADANQVRCVRGP